MVILIGLAFLSGTLPEAMAVAYAVERPDAMSMAGHDLAAMHDCRAADEGCRFPETLPKDCPAAAICMAAAAMTIPAGIAVSQDVDGAPLVYPGLASGMAGIAISPELSPPIDLA